MAPQEANEIAEETYEENLQLKSQRAKTEQNLNKIRFEKVKLKNETSKKIDQLKLEEKEAGYYTETFNVKLANANKSIQKLKVENETLVDHKNTMKVLSK